MDVGELNPAEYNPRTITKEALDGLKASINRFGYCEPIIINDDKTVIGGHQRLKALQELGINQAQVVQLNLNKTEEKALNVVLNSKHTGGEFDLKELEPLLTELKIDFDGFDELNLDALAEEFEFNLDIDDELDPQTEEDAIPDDPENVVIKLGDLIELGNHRLLCGDSTKKEDVERLMDGQKADMVFTDPPYGMSYGGGRARGDDVLDKKTGGVKIKSHGMIKGDDLQGEGLISLVKDSISLFFSHKKEGGAGYVCFTWRMYKEFENALNLAGADVKACIVWDKKSIGLGYSNYRPQHEFIFYCSGQWYGQNNEADVWYMSRGATGEYVHPTQKPVELIARAISNSSKQGDLITDAFTGSGSTLIACEKTNRKCHGMELDEKYAQVIIQRRADYTGKDEVEINGETVSWEEYKN